MKPNFPELLFASRYMLPLWGALVLWLWLSGHWERIWNGFDGNDRGLAVLFLCMAAAAILKVFPKVWAYEQAKRDAAAAARDPEQVKRRRRFLLRLAGVAAWVFSLWWVANQSYIGNPNVYLTAVGVAAAGSLWGLLSIYRGLRMSFRNRLRGSVSREQKAFIVRWCQSVPKRAPNAQQIQAGVPDYCQLLLSSQGNNKKSESLVRIPELVNP